MRDSQIIALFLDYVDRAQKEHRYAYEKVGVEDKRTQDLLHSLELEATTYKDRAAISSKLTRSRRDRRYYKDVVQKREPIINFLDDKSNWKAISMLKNKLGEIRKIEEYHEHRTYVPRVEKEKLKKKKE